MSRSPDRWASTWWSGGIVSGVVQPGAAVDCRYADGSSVEFSEVPDPGAPRTYTIAGRDELLAFAPQDGSAVGETVQDLTILDPDNTISDHDLSFVKNRVGKIAGTLTVEGTSLTTTEVLFNDGGFTVDGGIVFRNCAQLFNLNGMKSMTAVGGDLVFENCPKIATNWGAGSCLSQIESVAGSVKLSGVAEPMAGVTFLSLRSVGGDFTGWRTATATFWGISDVLPLETAGRPALTIRGTMPKASSRVWAFSCGLRSVGGNVTVTGNGAESGGIPVESGSGQVGLVCSANFTGRASSPPGRSSPSNPTERTTGSTNCNEILATAVPAGDIRPEP